ncbi:MAG: hypothetical protein ABIF82_08635 [Planctomycetota bacterium]
MLPWHDTYMCAIDAATGKPEGQGRYVTVHKGLSLEGALAANAVNIFATQGRSPMMNARHAVVNGALPNASPFSVVASRGFSSLYHFAGESCMRA